MTTAAGKDKIKSQISIMLSQIKINNTSVATVDSSAVIKSKNLINSNAVKEGKVIHLSYFGTGQFDEVIDYVGDGQFLVTTIGNTDFLLQKNIDVSLGYRVLGFQDDCLYTDSRGGGYTFDSSIGRLKQSFGDVVRYDEQTLTAAQQTQARENIGFKILTESEYDALVTAHEMDPDIVYMTTEED